MVHVKSFTVRLDGALEIKFDKIKDDLGLKNDVEVVRFLIKNYNHPGAELGRIKTQEVSM
ncbi:MAG: hypothetical protein Q6365_016410 [Candidatus Sigynarchaeota archaeon]